jgi:predicted extracellular nuclease
MNLLNFFNTLDTSGDNCRGGLTGAVMGCRGANSTVELDRQVPKTVAAVSGTAADVVAFMEMENDGYGPDSAVQLLVDKLNEKDGAGTWAFVDADARTGQVDALGNDAIKVGMLYKPATVTPVGRTAALNSVAFVNGGDGDPRNRPALAQAFQDKATGGVFIAVANHLKSKGSACDKPDAGDGQGNCNAVRKRAAELLANWLATDPTGTGDDDVLLLGDMNSYAKEDPITVFEDNGFTNLIADRNGPEAYSYVFDGQWGYLDHALGSASLAGQVTGVGDWHINSDEPSVLDYNTEFKTPNLVQSLYAADQFRVSDHDPVVVGLDLHSDIAAFATGSGFFTSPAGAIASDPSATGKGQFTLSAMQDAGATPPTGTFTFVVDGTSFSVVGTAVDWLVVHGTEARFSGPATVGGVGGYEYTVVATDNGKRDDRMRVVVRDSGSAVVYDSGSQLVRGGQVTVH